MQKNLRRFTEKKEGGDGLKRIFSIVLMGVLLITIGCTPVNTISNEEKENEVSSLEILENNSVDTLLNSKYEFTYLEELPMEKLEKYNLFLKDGETYHLRDFTPEEIVLIFTNLVMKHEVDKIYSLTYNNGQLPSIDIFRNEYDLYLSHYLEEDYLKYRFYDSISVNEETKKEDMVVVQMEIIYGNSTWIKTHALKKDGNVWKMDLYHLVEKLKNDKE